MLWLLPSASRMRLFTPTQSRRLNEVMGFLFLAAGILVLLSFASFQPTDPSWNTVNGHEPTQNLIGPIGAHLADLFLQAFGLAAFVFPVLMFGLGWKWIRSEPLAAPAVKLVGSGILVLSCCGGAALLPEWRLFGGTILPGGAAGFLVADLLRGALNRAGAAVVIATSLIVSVYLVSTFTLASLDRWFAPIARIMAALRDKWRRMVEHRREAALEKQELKRMAAEARRTAKSASPAVTPAESEVPSIVPEPAATQRIRKSDVAPVLDTPPWEDPAPPIEVFDSEETAELQSPAETEIPICRLDEMPVAETSNATEFPFTKAVQGGAPKTKLPTLYRLPSTELLNEVPLRSAFDEQELKNTAAAIKAKFEEFNVFGSVVQINPGPVVTTFEFKPEAGIKYSRITTLTEDLCLGLQAESILIERIPGKPTIGIEVPNTKREVISLRAVIESDEFQDSHSFLTISMGKDIN
ncbi:MAG TPA: DNA translocase FtsK 4TM domain-containing protein, partial [Bryobacteraceae bacterium]|nr:DNA translocase FtsK 4TM domain-containing protein [Bryobacteraceae bacterium]